MSKRAGPVGDGLRNRKKPRTDQEGSQDKPAILEVHEASPETFKDYVHGDITLHPLCVKIVNTPQFQRLCFIKQLGGMSFDHPAATHNRFDHSLGVCHLAGQLVTRLKKRHGDLISDVDILCVQIAGLCHDLGIGPFSRMFFEKFLPRTNHGTDIKLKHLSADMFDNMMEKNHLKEEFKKHKLAHYDIAFIKQQLRESKDISGRSFEQKFLYQIVENTKNGIDVDKWDCIQRDCRMLGINNTFDCTQLMSLARVLMIEEKRQICTRREDVERLYEMIRHQSTLQKKTNQHTVGNIIDTMIAEAMVKANEIMKIPGKGGEMKCLSEVVYDMEAYEKLTDSIIEKILMSEDEKLRESQKILSRVLTRNFYKCVGYTVITNNEYDIKNVTREYAARCRYKGLEEDDVIIDFVSLDYGIKEEKATGENYYFVDNEPDTPIQMPVWLLGNSGQYQIRFYCKKGDANSLEMATEAMDEWCEQKNLTKVLVDPNNV